LVSITSGIPQGSILCLLFFLLYSADIPSIAGMHGIHVHCYADDGQLYLFDKAGMAGSIISNTVACISEIDSWMSSNRLRLNSDKTQFTWIGTTQQLKKLDIPSINLGSNTVQFQQSVNNLGVTVDENLTMRDHVKKICRSSFYQLRQLRVVRKSLSTKACEALVHAFVSSRLDYCNCLLYGIAEKTLDQLQSVLRAAARLVLRKRKYDSISADIRDKLHWLPIRQRIEYKLCMMVYKCRHDEAPIYLSELLLPVNKSGRQNLRSGDRVTTHDLVIPRTNSARSGPRSFSVSGPTIWNSLPHSIRDSASVDIFRKNVKTFLFGKAYDD